MNLEQHSDAQLMTCISRGGMACLGELARRYGPRVRNLAFRLLGRWDEADDVAQETFLRVRRAAGRYRPEAQFTTWLHRIVVNLCHDEQRRERRRPGSLSPVEPGVDRSPGADMERDETARRVAQAVQRLPERQRTALVLHRYEGLSHQEVAQATGWSASAVESLLVRAYARLRKELADLQES